MDTKTRKRKMMKELFNKFIDCMSHYTSYDKTFFDEVASVVLIGMIVATGIFASITFIFTGKIGELIGRTIFVDAIWVTVTIFIPSLIRCKYKQENQ